MGRGGGSGGDHGAGPATAIPENLEVRWITAKDFNTPHSGCWFRNSRGKRIHVRYWLPPEKVEVVMIFFHGYGAHINGPTTRRAAAELTPKNIALFSMDAEGHGYSEGERAYIEDFNLWIADTVQYAKIVLSGCDVPWGDGYFGPDVVRYKEALSKAPFAVMGQSMGGSLSLMLGLRITQDDNLSSRFLGAALLCPGIKPLLPPKPLLFVLRYILAKAFPLQLVPEALEPVKGPHRLWRDPQVAVRCDLDTWGCEGACGWGHCMRFGTGDQLLQLLEEVERNLERVEFPFIIVHDPADEVVRFKGSAMLYEQAKTPSRDKQLHRFEGGLHDLLTNELEPVCELIDSWIRKRCRCAAVDEAATSSPSSPSSSSSSP